VRGLGFAGGGLALGAQFLDQGFALARDARILRRRLDAGQLGGAGDRGVQLAPPEQAMADRLPGIALQVLAGIPRIDDVRDAIAWQAQRYDGNNHSGPRGDAIPLAARLLRLALDADQGLAAGLPPGHVLADLAERGGTYDPQVLAALAQVAPFNEQVTTAHAVTLAQLRPGDRLEADVLTETDTLLVGRGAEVTEQVIERLHNFDRQVPLRQPLFVVREA